MHIKAIYFFFYLGTDTSLNGGLPHDLHNVKVHDFSEVKVHGFADVKPIIHQDMNNHHQYPAAVSPNQQCYDLKLPFQNSVNGQSQTFEDGAVRQSPQVFDNQSLRQTQVFNDVVSNQSSPIYSDNVNVITSNQSPTRTFNESPVFSGAESLAPEPLSPQQVLNTNISPAYNTNTDEKLYLNIVDIKNTDNQFDLPLSSKLPTFTALVANTQSTNSSSGTFLQPQTEQKSVLEELLTKKTLSPLDDVNASSPSSMSSPDYRDESPSSISSPNSAAVIHDTNTQSTLIAKSERLRIHVDSETQDDMQILDQVNWNLLTPDNEPSKALKSRRDSDAPSAAKENEPELVEKLFDAGIAASSTNDFIFSKFGSDLQGGLFKFGEPEKNDGSQELNSSSVIQ